MMDSEVLNILKTRRSCRVFDSRMPERAVLEAVCEAGTYAPTGHGKQSPVILAITDSALRNRLSAMNARIMERTHPLPSAFDPFYGAPVVLVVLADKSVPTYFQAPCCAN